jgi:hypothetical protein
MNAKTQELANQEFTKKQRWKQDLFLVVDDAALACDFLEDDF